MDTWARTGARHQEQEGHGPDTGRAATGGPHRDTSRDTSGVAQAPLDDLRTISQRTTRTHDTNSRLGGSIQDLPPPTSDHVVCLNLVIGRASGPFRKSSRGPIAVEVDAELGLTRESGQMALFDVAEPDFADRPCRWVGSACEIRLRLLEKCRWARSAREKSAFPTSKSGGCTVARPNPSSGRLNPDICSSDPPTPPTSGYPTPIVGMMRAPDGVDPQSAPR